MTSSPPPTTVSADPMPDHAAERDARGLPIDRVGITDLRYPVQVLDRAQGMQATVATLSLYVGLPHHFKGTHMSRFIEILNEVRGELTFRTMPGILDSVRRRLESDEAWVEMEFPYFVPKRAPVSGAPSLMEYTGRFVGHRGPDGADYTLGVTVPVTSLCPCSKSISEYGAHNQRSFVHVEVRAGDFVWLEDLIDAVEACASAPLYALLKREDEKFVTEQAYDNPKFVEDLVRDCVIALRELPGMRWMRVRAENQESIHNHSATAEIEWSAEEQRATGGPVAPAALDQGFGPWLKTQRSARGVAQKDLAAALAISPSYLSQVESGRKAASAESVQRLATVWGLDPVSLQLRAGLVPAGLMAAIARDPEGFRGWAAGR